MLKSAIVTGASSGIGKALSKKLLDLGYEVYGFARDFSKSNIENEFFHPILIDLSKEKEFPKIENLHILIHSAGIGYFAPTEDLSSKKIEEMIDLNLKAPLLLTNFYLRELKKKRGTIIFISSISAIQPAIFGTVYGATKAALRHYAKSLFKEARKSGLRVVNINPDITKTPFFDDLSFKPTKNSLSFIEPNDLSDLLEDILKLRDGTVVTELTIEPQLFQLEKR